MDVTQLALTWVEWPNGEKLALTCVQIWSQPKSAQVILSQRKGRQAGKAWPNGVASRPHAQFSRNWDIFGFSIRSLLSWPLVKGKNTLSKRLGLSVNLNLYGGLFGLATYIAGQFCDFTVRGKKTVNILICFWQVSCVLAILKLINNSTNKNKENHNREGGFDTLS